MTEQMREPPPRRPGRPRLEISLGDVADAAVSLFNQGGYDAVAIEAIAERLSVSRATLYRTVPTKEHLLGIVLERYTSALAARVEAHLAEVSDPAAALEGMIRIQVDAAVRSKEYFTVLIGGAGVHSDAYRRWLKWSRYYEALWRNAIERAVRAGVLSPSDPKVTTRLVLGMTLWVSRWYRKSEGYTADEIAQVAVDLILAPARRPYSDVDELDVTVAASPIRAIAGNLDFETNGLLGVQED